MKTIIKKGIAVFVSAVMMTGIIAVSQPGVKAEAKAKLSKVNAAICTGETLQLKLAGAKKIKWKSSKNAIASVDKNGLVTGKNKGNCVVTATSDGKNYSCKVTVKALPKNYATVNGKKVKVGEKVKITYKLTAPAPVSDVSVRYYFYGDQIQIVTSGEDKMRFKTWKFFNGFEEPIQLQGDLLEEYKSEFKGMKKGKKPMLCFQQCAGVNPDNPEDTNSYPISCKNGKEFDSFYIKALKSGNFTFKTTFFVSKAGKAVKYTMKETIKEDAVSKQGLTIELQEVVMDTQNIYAVVKITAPANVEFKEGMTFDYFGFCEGTNYNADSVLGGLRGCTLLEVLEDKKNVAKYVVNIAADEQIKEGKDVTVFFKDLLDGPPYKDDTKILLEGMWSLSFAASYTDLNEITVNGTDDMKYAFAGTTADIKEITLTPLGISLTSDVSKVDDEILNTTDTNFIVSMKMIDGNEVIVSSPDVDTDCLASGGTITQSEKNGRVYLKYVYQFREAIDTNQVLGITISDYFVPLKDYE